MLIYTGFPYTGLAKTFTVKAEANAGDNADQAVYFPEGIFAASVISAEISDDALKGNSRMSFLASTLSQWPQGETAIVLDVTYTKAIAAGFGTAYKPGTLSAQPHANGSPPVQAFRLSTYSLAFHKPGG